MLDFRNATFLSGCKHMNFTKAAKECNITQPAVTQQIHYLEEFYQTKLFHYVGKKLILTEAGAQLEKVLLSSRSNFDSLKDHFMSHSTEKNAIKMGATFTIGQFVIPGLLARFMQNNPSYEIDLTVQNTSVLLPMLTRGEIDFAFIEGYFSKQDFAYRHFRNEHLIGVYSRDYPLQKKNALFSVDDLLEEHLLIREVGSGSREILEHALLEKNIALDDFHAITCVNNPYVLLELAKKGLGITFLFESAVKDSLMKGELEMLDLKDFEITHPFSFVYRKDSLFEEEYLSLFSHMYSDEKESRSCPEISG